MSKSKKLPVHAKHAGNDPKSETRQTSKARKAQPTSPGRHKIRKSIEAVTEDLNSPIKSQSSRTDLSPFRTSKQSVLLDLLRRTSGAKLDDLCSASGWQAHSVRGFLSGTVRKKLGLSLEAFIGNDGRTYRIVVDDTVNEIGSAEEPVLSATPPAISGLSA